MLIVVLYHNLTTTIIKEDTFLNNLNMDQSYLIYLNINLPLWLLLLHYDTVDEKTSMHHDKVLVWILFVLQMFKILFIWLAIQYKSKTYALIYT